MYSSIQEQYDMYCGPAAANKSNKNSTWLSLIYLTQFPVLESVVKKLAIGAEEGKYESAIMNIHKIMERFLTIRILLEKAMLVVAPR